MVKQKEEIKSKKPIPVKVSKTKHPPGKLSRLLFCWMLPALYHGNRRDLDEHDLVPALDKYNSKLSGDKLEREHETFVDPEQISRTLHKHLLAPDLNFVPAIQGNQSAGKIPTQQPRCLIYSYLPPNQTYIWEWLEEQAAASASGLEPSLIKALIRAFALSYLPGGIMQFIYVLLSTGTPLLFAQLLSYWSAERTMTRETAAIYAISMILINWLAAFFNRHGNLYCMQFGMRVRVALSSAMFRKIMRMSHGSLEDTAAGKVVNILSNDLQRCELAFLFMHYVWIMPLQLAIVCWLGYVQAGYAALIGFASLMVIALPAQGKLSKIIGKFRVRIAERTDERIKLMSEVIGGIQVIKMYAWEIPFEKEVNRKRSEEIKQIRIANLLRSTVVGFAIFGEKAAVFLTLLTFLLLGNFLSANVIYPLLQFMSSIEMNITRILPMMVTFVSELLVSLRRIKEFLVLAELDEFKTKNTVKSSTLFKKKAACYRKENIVRPISYKIKSGSLISNSTSPTQVVGSRFCKPYQEQEVEEIEVRNVSASWTDDPSCLALKDVSLRLHSGQLCAVIGPVGSGKSSFLQLLLKELPAATGSVSILGKISYASQEAWLFPSTVRENILFGLPYNAEKYKRVCKACALEKDFKQFPFGDQTLVDERGVSLSGGQRARINLARAVYQESDIYLLDDPLSAVDAKVGRQLFEDCINGYLRGRTRILVTHQIHFLKAVDLIVVLNKGSIENMGTFEELVSNGKEFFMMLASSMHEEKDTDSENVKSLKLQRSGSTVSDVGEAPVFEAQRQEAEGRQSGNVRWDVISSFFCSGNSLAFIFFTMSIIFLASVSAATVDYFLSFWFNQMAAYEEKSVGPPVDASWHVIMGCFTTAQYLTIHGVLIVACIVITNARVFPFASLCMSSLATLHNNMFSNVLKAPMRFFASTSSGRILNRFSKDMGALDDTLPRLLLDVLQNFSKVAGILILNFMALYWTLLPSVVLVVIFTLLCKTYLPMAHGLKRIESTLKSPVFAMVTSSLSGIVTIRASGSQQRLIEEFDEHQNLHTKAYNGYLCGGIAFGLYLDTLCLLNLALVIFLFLYLDFGGAVAIGSVGLAVTQSSTLAAMLTYGARMLVEFLAQLTSVERVIEYTRIENESNLFQGQIFVPPTWPSEGRIVFDNVSMRYAPDKDPVLKNLNIEIQSGWKVGVVGRTGAGKSSLISALFRFAYLEGKVLVDGIDTSQVAKQELRSKMSIIPQEPVLFSATLRYNLDPLNVYSDVDIWNALEKVDMKSAVPSLDFKVTEGGSNFSVGQRQLLCLARALLRFNKVLIMDEATANVDPQTDAFIQKTIRSHFRNCTVITIAHRLNTIMDYDRVMVMDTGVLAEFDHPHILLSDSNSHLLSMLKETGEKNSANLMQIAKDAYFQHNLEENAR